MSARTDPLAAALADRPAWAVGGLAVAIVVGTLLAVVAVVVVAAVTAPVSPLSGPVHQAAVGIPVVLLLYEGTRRLAGVPANDLLAGRPSRRVWGWAAVGLGLPTALLGVQLPLLGAVLTVEPPAPAGLAVALVASVLPGLLAGLLEELALRGALLRVLEVRWGPRAAVGLTAAGFAALHQGHAGGGRELALVLTSMFAAGLLLGLVAVRTRSAWNAVAVHAGWNTVFGGRLVAEAAAGEPAVVSVHLPEADAILAGAGATLGAAPLTTIGLLVAAGVVAGGPDRWFGRRGSGRAGRPLGGR